MKSVQSYKGLWEWWCSQCLVIPYQLIKFKIYIKDCRSKRIRASVVRVSPSNVRCYTHMVSTMYPPEHEPNKASNKRHAEVHRGKPGRAQPCIKNYTQLRNARRRNKSSLGKSTQLVTQYQMVSPENIHTRNIIQTEQVIWGGQGCNNNRGRDMCNKNWCNPVNLDKNVEGNTENLDTGKGREKQ